MHIRFNNVRERVIPADIDAVHHVIDSGKFILGDSVKEFEHEWARACGSSFAVGVASGTDAITLLLHDLPKGSFVITQANTAPATYVGILRAGCVPYFVDINPSNGLIDVTSLPKDPHNLGGTVSAVLPVHLFGQMVDMEAFDEYTTCFGLDLFEDACQAHGSSDLHGIQPGVVSDGAAYSFYPTKNLGCFGDGGAVVTPWHTVAHRIRRLRFYGFSQPTIPLITNGAGYNSRLDELQAAVLLNRIPMLRIENSRRIELTTYLQGLVKGRLIAGGNHHIVATRVKDRDAARAFLDDKGVETMVHYPIPGYLQEDDRLFDPKARERLPHTHQWCEEIMSIPVHPDLTGEEIDYLAEQLNQIDFAEPIGYVEASP